MLQNFLKLVEAIETMGLLEIDTDAINRADQLMKAYLDEAKELYRWAKVQPNNHLALHPGIFLRLVKFAEIIGAHAKLAKVACAPCKGDEPGALLGRGSGEGIEVGLDLRSLLGGLDGCFCAWIG